MGEVGVDIGATRAALDALPIAALVIAPDHRVVVANHVAAFFSGGLPAGRNRMYAAVASSEPVATALAKGEEATGIVSIPSDIGVIDRLVTACPLAGTGSVVASFAPGASTTGTTDALRPRLDAMLEHTSEMITVLGRDGTIQFSNRAAGRITGFRGVEVNGRVAAELIHPDDIEMVTRLIEEALEHDGPTAPIELRIKFADGRWHTVEAHVNNLLSVEGIEGLVVSMHDITERRAAEARLEALIANLTDVIVVLNDAFEVTFTTNSITRLIDAPAESNIGQSVFNDIHPDDVSPAIETLAALKDGGPGTTRRLAVRLESRPGTGDWRWVEAIGVNLFHEPAIEGIVVTVRDVTDEKRATMHLERALATERANAERLIEVDRMKDEFVATVSHELRTPLATIVGFTDLLRNDDIDDALRGELLDRIATSAADIRSMVDNVIDFSALEAGTVALTLEPLRVRRVVDIAVASAAQPLATHPVTIDVGDEVVHADEHGLAHVLRNLLINAAKYSEPTAPIEVRVRRDRAVLIIDVIDEGIGVAPEDAERIFERFYRALPASFSARGSGMGLNIARRYVELMGGTLLVRPAPERGSMFTITLPVT